MGSGTGRQRGSKATKFQDTAARDQAHRAAGTQKPQVEDLRPFAILAAMTLRDWVSLIGVTILLFGTATSVGFWLERQARGAAISAVKEPLKNELEQQGKELQVQKDALAALRGDVGRLRRANEALAAQAMHLKNAIELAESFQNFARNYINYLDTRGEPAKSILIDYVCALYRESQSSAKDISLGFAPTADWATLPSETLIDTLEESGFNPDLVRELRELHSKGVVRQYPVISRYIGVTVEPKIDRKTVPLQWPFGRPVQTDRGENDRRSEILDRVRSRLNADLGAKLVKTVTFPGQEPYTLPDEIAFAVHSNPACRVK